MPIALAQPNVDGAVPSADETALVADVNTRVAGWQSIVASSDPSKCVAYYTFQKSASLGTESVMNALVLVNHDVRRSRAVLSPTTEEALSYLWQQQKPDGSWGWIEFGLRPWEGQSTYYGAALGAVAAGMAGREYLRRPDIQDNLVRLKAYLQNGLSTQTLHDQTVTLWASTYLPGLLTPAQQTALVSRLLSIQQKDGGWTLTSLGVSQSNPNGWSSGGVYPAGSLSDGFATGLVVLTLKRLGVSERSAQLHLATQWLDSHETDGSWPVNYINGWRDPQSNEGCFMRDAGTSFAILALSEPSRR